MFLDYLHSDKKKISTQYNYGNASVRMPQIVMLIGEFEAEETDCLKNNLKQHFAVDSHVFWVCAGNTNFSSDQKKSFLEQRLEFSNLINDEPFHTFCEKTAADIFNSTASLNCQEPEGIYFSVVCKAEQTTSGLLIPIIEKMKDLLLEQFVFVYADLYLLLDQSAYREQKLEKESALYLSLLEAEQLVNDKILRLAYVMSNIDSKGRLHDKIQVSEEMYAAIALMISMKNRIPDNTDYRYSDTDFGKSVVNLAQSQATEAGLLASIGHMRLQIDEEFNTLAMYLAVWNKLAETTDETKLDNLICEFGMEKGQISQYFTSLYRMSGIDAADFETIVRNRNLKEESIHTIESRKKAIENFFGKNLALYYELNVHNHNMQQRIIDWFNTLDQKINNLPSDINNIDIEKLLKRIEDNIRSLVDESDELLENEEKKLSEWESARFCDNVGKEGNPLFVLATTYIRMRNNVYKETQKKQLYEELLLKIADLRKYYHKYKALVGETIESIEAALTEKKLDAAKPGNGSGLLQIANAKKYYQDVTTDLLMKSCAKDFRQLSNELRKMVSNRAFHEEKVYKLIMSFCEKSVFKNLLFKTDFLEEIQNRLIGYKDEGKGEIKTGTDVSNFLLISIIDAQHTLYYDAIHQGFQTYEEMCLCLRDDSIFMKEKDRDAHVANVIREQKMKLFCDKNSDTLDVVFIAGNLKSRNLHKWKNYENSYKKLMENT